MLAPFLADDCVPESLLPSGSPLDPNPVPMPLLFPPELLTLIGSHLINPDLANYGLASQTLQAVAQPLLYRDIEVAYLEGTESTQTIPGKGCTAPACLLLLQTLRVRPALGLLVKGLRFTSYRCYTNLVTHVRRESDLKSTLYVRKAASFRLEPSPEVLPSVWIAVCPRLSTLDLSRWRYDSVDLPSLVEPILESLTTLRLRWLRHHSVLEILRQSPMLLQISTEWIATDDSESEASPWSRRSRWSFHLSAPPFGPGSGSSPPFCPRTTDLALLPALLVPLGPYLVSLHLPYASLRLLVATALTCPVLIDLTLDLSSSVRSAVTSGPRGLSLLPTCDVRLADSCPQLQVLSLSGHRSLYANDPDRHPDSTVPDPIEQQLESLLSPSGSRSLLLGSRLRRLNFVGGWYPRWNAWYTMIGPGASTLSWNEVGVARDGISWLGGELGAWKLLKTCRAARTSLVWLAPCTPPRHCAFSAVLLEYEEDSRLTTHPACVAAVVATRMMLDKVAQRDPWP